MYLISFSRDSCFPRTQRAFFWCLSIEHTTFVCRRNSSQKGNDIPACYIILSYMFFAHEEHAHVSRTERIYDEISRTKLWVMNSCVSKRTPVGPDVLLEVATLKMRKTDSNSDLSVRGVMLVFDKYM